MVQKKETKDKPVKKAEETPVIKKGIVSDNEKRLLIHAFCDFLKHHEVHTTFNPGREKPETHINEFFEQTGI
jgi:hypothetical protein